jgi:hypothetical protein
MLISKSDALIWWKSIDYMEWMKLSEEAIEKLLLDKWSHKKSKDKECTKGLFSGGKIYIADSWLYS